MYRGATGCRGNVVQTDWVDTGAARGGVEGPSAC